MAAMTVSEARAELSAVLDRVAAGEEIELTRHGRTVAVIVAPERMRLRREAARTAIAEADELGRRIHAATEEGGAATRRTGRRGAHRAEELAKGVGRDRGRR